MITEHLPRWGDHFPKTKTGHGSTHPQDRVHDGVVTRNACPCVNETCQLTRNKGGETHEDQKANADQWKDEHGLLPPQKSKFKLPVSERAVIEKYAPRLKCLLADRVAEQFFSNKAGARKQGAIDFARIYLNSTLREVA